MTTTLEGTQPPSGTSRSRLRRPALAAALALVLVLTGVTVSRMLGGPAGLVGDFEAGFRSWDLGGPSVMPDPGATVTLEREVVFQGDAAARASIPGGGGNKFARTLWGNTSGQSGELGYGEGDELKYGMALYLPPDFYENMQSYFVPMRWDNFGADEVSRGGLGMYEDRSIRLFREREGESEQENLLGGETFKLTPGRWHQLEVRQRLSDEDGRALNELRVDGEIVGTSTAANYYGTPISAMRYGIVAIGGDQTRPLTVIYDEAFLSEDQ